MAYDVGAVIHDKYVVEQLLGEGAFGDVYQVRHIELKVKRAVKVLKHDAPGFGSTIFDSAKMRFRMEAELGAALNSPSADPHLLQVHDQIVNDTLCLLEMEYAPGKSLSHRIIQYQKKGEPFPVEEAIRVAMETALGLATLHEHDIVHRDIKPANILFDDRDHVKVADLGLAQIPGGPSMRSQHSNPLPHPGTPGYMSPEQQNTTHYLTFASDIYSLGLTLFEMLTGKSYSLRRPGTSASEFRKDIPEPLNVLLLRMLSPEPDKRPWDGAETVKELQKLMPQVVVVMPEPVKVEPVAPPAVAVTAAPGEQPVLRSATDPTTQVTRPQKSSGESRLIRLPITSEMEMEFVFINSSTCLMGSDKNADSDAGPDEFPQHRVELAPYCISRYPITNLQYQAFVQATGHRSPGHWQYNAIPKDKENHPVVKISWHDAQAFCQWAQKVAKKNFRLPTEAEWENSARGMDGRIYPWGNDAPDEQHCNFGKHVNDTTPVSKYSPVGDSAYGCGDMAGNVREWVADWYDEFYYKTTPVNNPPGPLSGERKVTRGGSWSNDKTFLRAAFRDRFDPESGGNSIGFRCVFSS